MNRRRVLVIEDEESISGPLSEALEREGYSGRGGGDDISGSGSSGDDSSGSGSDDDSGGD